MICLYFLLALYLYSSVYPISSERALHCVKSVRIRIYSGPHFSAFVQNTDQNNSEYGQFLLRISPYSVRMRENTDSFYTVLESQEAT